MLLSSLATSIYARITLVLGLCAWGIPTAVGFSQMTSCRLQSNYSSMASTQANVEFSSKYVKYYEAINVNGRTKAKCRQCNKLLSYHGSTSSMKYHLER